MADSSVTLNSGTGGAALATYTDAGSQVHQKVVLETQSSAADPVKVNSTNPLPVTLANTGANATAVKVDGSAVTQPVSGTVTANIGTSGSLALDASVTGLQVAQGSTTSGQKGSLAQGAVTTGAPTYTTAQTAPLSLDTSGNLRVTVANGVSAGTAGTPSSQVMTVQGVASMTPVQTTVGPPGGASYNNAIAPATPAVTTVKSSAGSLLSITALNMNSTPVYLKFFDATAPTLGTTACSFQIPIPGNTGGAGVTINRTLPRAFANAIKYAVTGAIGATDNTAITANTVVVDIDYN